MFQGVEPPEVLDWSQHLFMRLCDGREAFLAEAKEDEGPPAVNLNRFETVVLLTEIFDPEQFARFQQFPIVPIAPAMVGARKLSSGPTSVCNHSRMMSAYVPIGL